jgi:hypothetical protein
MDRPLTFLNVPLSPCEWPVHSVVAGSRRSHRERPLSVNGVSKTRAAAFRMRRGAPKFLFAPAFQGQALAGRKSRGRASGQLQATGL